MGELRFLLYAAITIDFLLEIFLLLIQFSSTDFEVCFDSIYVKELLFLGNLGFIGYSIRNWSITSFLCFFSFFCFSLIIWVFFLEFRISRSFIGLGFFGVPIFVGLCFFISVPFDFQLIVVFSCFLGGFLWISNSRSICLCKW